MTVLFADLSGFTGLSERIDPEDVRAVVDSCMGAMTTIVERYGGAMTRVIGDALMVVFGAPLAHEDDAERAVRAALELQRYAKERPEDLGGLTLRVGINTGEVMVATVGHERDVTVMGDVVNVAARLQGVAPRGGILVGEETQRLTGRAIRYQHPETLPLKGKESPVRAFLAAEALAVPGEHLYPAVPMVGREGELALLGTIWARVVEERRPHLVTVLGPPGIGKSCLCREFVRLVRDQGGRSAVGRCRPYGESAGYGAFGHQLKALAGILESDLIPVARGKLGECVSALLSSGSAREVASHLALLVGLGTERAVADRAALFLSARRFVEGLAIEEPTVLVFEDIHWADPSLLDLIESLAARCRDAPVLFLTLARPELFDQRAAWGGRLTSATTLELAPLAAADGRKLVSNLLPGVSDPIIVERLMETAGGNPLFVEELTASFVEQATEITAALPNNVKAIIAARLDTLPVPDRQVLLDASVIGMLFWRGALERLGDDGTLAERLDSLEARDLIRRHRTSRLEGEEEFSFKHALIRDVAYARLPRAARRERHVVAARFLEEAAGERVGELAPNLAHHWQEAGDSGRALEYLLLAAEKSAQAWALGEGVSLYTRALDLIAEGNLERRRSIRLRLAVLLVHAARYEGAVEELDSLIPELDGHDRIEALIMRQRCAVWQQADAPKALALARQAVDLAEALGDQELLGPALSALSFGTALTSGAALPEAIRLGERALEVWPPGRRDLDLAFHLASTGLQGYFLGRNQEAVDYGRRAYDLGREIHASEPMTWGAGQHGLGLIGLGRHEEAIGFLERVVARGLEVGSVPAMTARAMNVCACAYREIFDLEAARRLNDEAAELARRATFPTAVVQAGVDLLFADLAEDEFGNAEAAWPELWEAASGLQGFHQWLVAGRLETARAEILLGLGAVEEAATAASRAIAGAGVVHRLKYEVASRHLLGSALFRLARLREAHSELRRAAQGAEQLGHPPSVWRSAALLSRVLVALGDDGGAEAAAKNARRAVETFAAGLSEARQSRFLAATPVVEILVAGR